MNQLSSQIFSGLDEILMPGVEVIDDGCDHTQRIIWSMNAKRRIREGINTPRPDAPRVIRTVVRNKKKTHKRARRTVKKDEELCL